jgi:catechol 2,3-dioxygenase-like lactoylglutathione lyase family enzyme
MTPFRLERLDHVSLNVSDRARSIAWYRDVLGLQLMNDPQADDWPAFMGNFGMCIGLFQAQTAAPRRAAESVGLRHIAFMVGKDDLDRAQTHLTGQRVDFRFEDHGDTHSVYFRDPDGHVIELTTYDV